MTLRSVLALVLCCVGLATTGAAAAAAPPSVLTFTLYGLEPRQSLAVDANGNGEIDPGDALSIRGPLSNTQRFVVGDWRARVEFADQTNATVRAAFRFRGGELRVRGQFDPSAGAPPALNVYLGLGSFAGATGTLAVANLINGNVFTFTLNRGPWQP